MITSRRNPHLGVLEGSVLTVYAGLLAWCVPLHESWFDEVQAWQIARDSSLIELFTERLHYEGTPGLWHLLLWVLIRLGSPFFGMHILAACLAITSIYVWLRNNPLPPIISILMPFTFFLQYQFAVVARSYVLAPLCAYLLMTFYQNRKSSSMAFCIIAGLLANCSVHMAALSAGLVLLYLYDRIRYRDGAALPLQQLIGPISVLCILVTVAVLTAAPTADGSSTSANPIVTALRTSASTSGVSQLNQAGEEDITTGVHLEQPPPQGAWETTVWYAMQSGNHPGTLASRWMNGRTIRHLLVFATAATASVSTSNAVAIIFWILFAINVLWARLWVALLPWFFVQAINVLVAGEAHHFGLLWVAITCSLWALWLEQPKTRIQYRVRSGLLAYLIFIVLLQVGWSLHALLNDVHTPYSSSKDTAAYLDALPAHVRIAAFDDDSISVNAYLPRSPYFNQNVDYWPFSRTKDPSLFMAAVMLENPDVVSVKMSSPIHPVMDQWVKMTNPGVEFISPTVLKFLNTYHYRETHRFCGQRSFRDTVESNDCRVLFERTTSGNTPSSVR